MKDGGYDEGYSKCDCFWGSIPAEMVETACRMLGASHGMRAIDLGCGEGKNALAMASAGFSVTALDISEFAIIHAIAHHNHERVTWLNMNFSSLHGPAGQFDLAIATGSFHCLKDEEDVSDAVSLLQRLTKPGGLNVLYSFNSGPHDMSGHPPSFQPVLLSHQWYLDRYRNGWKVLASSDLVQPDVHPDTNIPHSHSITRLLARKL